MRTQVAPDSERAKWFKRRWQPKRSGGIRRRHAWAAVGRGVPWSYIVRDDRRTSTRKLDTRRISRLLGDLNLSTVRF